MKMNVPFGEWLPDQPGVAKNLTVATNVYPIANGYAGIPTPVSYGNAASEPLFNIFAGKSGGTTAIFAGGASKLFQYNNTTEDLDDVSKTGGYTAQGWDFVQFGNAVIAANGNDPIQVWNLGTSTEFDDLSASAPNAKYVTVVRDFVVAAGVSGADSTVYWSDINDETDWTRGATSQADSQVIPDGGQIRGLTGGEFGLVLMERAIHRMDYAGSPFFFQFSNISRGLGCLEGGSIAQYKNMTFFLSDDGFYMCDGQQVTPIGSEKVDRFFFDDVLLSEIDTISAAADPIRKLIVWNYQSNSGGFSQLIYHWPSQRWSYGRADVTKVAEVASANVSMDSSLFGTNIDGLTRTLDSRVYAGGKLLLAGVKNTSIKTFDGPLLTAEITTGDLGIEGVRSVITMIRPTVDGGSAGVSVASRDVLNENIQFGTWSYANTDGRCPVRQFGRYHRINLIPTGNWNSMSGMDLDIWPRGER